MLKVEVKASIAYTCTLTDEDEQVVREYAKKHRVSLDQAIKDCWEEAVIDVYAGDQVESDYVTQEVGYSEFNEE